MRIAHLACVAPPEIGGIGQVALEEVKHLRANGTEAVLFAPMGTEVFPPDPAVQRVHPHWRLGNAASLPKEAILTWKPDVIHLHYPFYGTAESWLWRDLSIPVVVTFHMDATPTGWRGLITNLHQRFIQPRLLRHAAAIIVSSSDYVGRSSMKGLLQKLQAKITEVPFSIDTTTFSPVSYPQRAEARLLFVGGMDQAHHFKGIPELLKALSGLVSESWHLALVGDGGLRSQYEKLAKEYGLTDRVTFRGRVSHSDLVASYQQSHILLFPSTTTAEAFGLVALEAESCGIPVIASDLPGVRTVVRHEETGLLVPPGDAEALQEAIWRLLKDEKLRTRLGTAARERVMEVYSWPVHVKALMEIYQHVCASPS